MVIKHHFVLVHGLMHGAWCWYKTVDLLRRAGHRVTTLDLASCGTHPADPNTISKFTVYNQPLVDLLLLLPETEKILQVGHSMAGFSVLDAMERFHRILKVYISAVLLRSGHIVLHVAGGQDVDFLIELNQISQIVEMESDHSPMLSAPEKFHQILLATADKYA
ncbi:unnamed protein product [Sphagnum jensenii]|uniref:AB hydrolase-1 domain-containing protein n=1 Tax=Sphagnum jensenii TaxID=128206 RepID=A0ABP1BQL1_9BRYO